jgi:hypothetical protein
MAAAKAAWQYRNNGEIMAKNQRKAYHKSVMKASA